MFQYLFQHLGQFGAVVALIGIWAVISFAVSGAWRSLARSYPDDRRPIREVFRFKSAQFRSWASYNNCVNFSADQQGIRLSVVFLFRVGHPPISIPWSDVLFKPASATPPNRAVLTFRKNPDVPVTVNRPLAERLLAAGGRSLAAATAQLQA